MKSVTTREIQQNTRMVRERLMAGESLQWKMHGRVVALLTPSVEPGSSVAWGDPLQRLKSISNEDSPAKEASASELIYRDRG